MPDRRQLGLQPLHESLERGVVEDHAVFGMVDDVAQLVVEQPRVERVEHSAHADDAEPGDQVAVVVHRQRGDAVAGLDAHPLQSLCQAPGIMSDTLPVGAMG
jgi:hypothetical protein